MLLNPDQKHIDSFLQQAVKAHSGIPKGKRKGIVQDWISMRDVLIMLIYAYSLFRHVLLTLSPPY